MLTIMRRHVGWGLKLVLGVVAVTFIFYFGYSRMARIRGHDTAAIQVGSEEISYSWYRFFYNDQYERTKEQFKGEEVPDFYQKIVENQTRQRVVYRNLIKQFAIRLGLTITDLELAEAITKNPNFDPVEYKNFLQAFYQNNSFSYEDLVREDLLVSKFQKWAKEFDGARSSAPETTWTFETLLVSGKEKKSEKVGPITLKERHRLFPGAVLTQEESAAIFSLTPARPTLAQPIKKGNQVLQVRLVEKKTAPPMAEETAGSQAANAAENFEPNLIDFWFREFANGIPIKSNLPQEAL